MPNAATGTNLTQWIYRGALVVYAKAPEKPLKVTSDMCKYNGVTVVTARTCDKCKNRRKYAFYEAKALIPWDKEAVP